MPSNGADEEPTVRGMYRGRFAPSPTGDLHLGSAACALLGWAWARRAGGLFVLRVEDIDTPRVRPGSEERQLDDLHWLGITWDEGPDVGGRHGPYRQSERTQLYSAALELLARQGLTYYCDCSRADIARSASAPHAGDEGPRYPGTCRTFGMSERPWKRPPAVRLRVPDRDIVLQDRLQGTITENVLQTAGDFVLRRGDGVFAYQLAVVVDDLSMAVTDVVRGVDLLGSAARQILLAELLGGKAPRYAHHAMIVTESGDRLAKRTRGTPLADYRQAGFSPGAVLAAVAAALALVPPASDRGQITSNEFLQSFDVSRLVGRKVAPIPALPPR